ncbi:MAG: hypothetical protein A2Z83_06925 [Omnitrophica bacterium GWA2_52_8]|nr:MAG: hypothetical protein A2Z83_06925 [Omnitrophica bacterium GWA2_52_8]
MPKRLKLIIILLTAILEASPASYGRQLLDRVVAVVNDEAITQSELDIILRPLYEEYRRHYEGSELLKAVAEARQRILSQLIEDRLVYQEAKLREVEVEPTRIDQDLEQFKAQFENQEIYEQALQEQGISETELRERLKRQAMIRYLHDSEIRSKIVISPTDLQNYYQKNIAQFSEEPKLKIRSITIKKSFDAREKGIMDEKAVEKIKSLRAQIIKGEDFDALAKANSEDTRAQQGGLSDWIRRGDMIAAIDDVIFKLNPGDVSEMIETPMGYHIFRIEEKQEGFKKTFDQVRDEIKMMIYQEQFRKRFDEWLTELKKKAYISIR